MDGSTQELKPNGSVSPAEKALALAQHWGLPEEPGQEEPQAEKPEVFKHNNGRFEVSSDGVHWIDGTDKPTRVCDRLRVEAKSRDPKGQGWGLLLHWRDGDGRAHSEVLPMELLHAESNDAVRQLASGGLAIASGRSLRTYLLAASAQVKGRVRFVRQVGWYECVYVTPDGTIGNQEGERVIFAPPPGSGATNLDCSQSGTAEQWRDTIATLAEGNSRLVLAISHTLAGPLLDIAGENEGCGMHFVGKSSIGKSTALRVAGSTLGPPQKRLQSWCATANGLEAQAALHNDGTLILDEIGQADTGEAGKSIYRVLNGQGKSRATQHGTAKESAGWRCNLLSSGEDGLADMEAGAGRKVKAGQEVRLANIPAEAGYGIFEELHGYEPAALANKLRELTNLYHGAVGRCWLEFLTGANREALRKTISEGVRDFVNEVAPPGSEAQVIRVARGFARAAVAGELATAVELTGWKEGEATEGCKRGFAAWFADFGVGSHEEQRIVEQTRGFMEQNMSRFVDLQTTDVRIPNLAGFMREQGGRKELLVLREVFAKEVCKGFRKPTVIEALKKHRILLPDKDEAAQRVKVKAFGDKGTTGNKGTTGVYVLAFPEEETA